MKIQTYIKEIKGNDQTGFTLIELLVVIGILAILLAVTLIAINPNKHFEDARNAQRQSNVAAILDAIYEYESSNNGKEPPSVANVTATPASLGSIATETASTTVFSGPSSLTYLFGSGNVITTGTVAVSGCSNTADDGTFTVSSGAGTYITVTNGSGASGATGCSIGSWSGAVDVCTDLIPTYLAAMPTDPSGSTGTACSGTYNSGYTISQSNGRFTISAPSAEDGASISVTR